MTAPRVHPLKAVKALFSRRSPTNRRGAIVVLTAAMMVMILAMVSFSVDVGYMCTVRTELQRAVDAAAHAGAGMLVNGSQAAEEVVRDYIHRNVVGDREVSDDDIQVEVGHWDVDAKMFSPSSELPSAIRVLAARPDQPLFFGPVINHHSFDLQAEAIARYQPRDIVLVLDYSASMNDDSELRSVDTIGQAQIEANLQQIWMELGSPTFGNMQWDPQYISSNKVNTIKKKLGLKNLPYPYPSGSWAEYINYVKNDSTINNSGYRKKYGYLTLINYWLDEKPKYNETPDLWQTSEQPVTAVKDAVTVFLAYLQEVPTDDRLGLSVYTSSESTAKLESELTSDFQLVEDISRHLQAGHYDRYTNIGAGIHKARIELEQNARTGAFKMIVLMTDGIANRPTNTSVARQFALDEADLAALSKFPIVTISLGANADTGLMQQIADVTGGIHFNIPGGQSVSSYEEELKDVFREIADSRPLLMVK